MLPAKLKSALIGSACILSIATAAPGQSEPEKFAKDWGAQPTLVQPEPQWIPTVNIAPAVGWPNSNAKPEAAEGLKTTAFARGLKHPRWLLVLPNNDVLVAESNAPAKSGRGGIRGYIMGWIMSEAGAGVPSPDRIMLVRDADGDGVAEIKKEFITGLKSPFGMALIGNKLYVANTDAILEFDYQSGADKIEGTGKKIVDLPAGEINHHWTKNIIPSKNGTKLYATVGSNSNVGEMGLENEKNRAAILEVDIESKTKRIFASGLRNPNGMDWEPTSGELWTVVNERDEIGDQLVPDFMTSVKEGAFYGWPYSYYGQHVDKRVEPMDKDKVESAIKPDYALGAHTASLGLIFSKRAALMPETYSKGAFVGQHGSWNRSKLVGYQVVFIPFSNGMPSGPPIDVLSGFVNEEGEARGRPVGVAIDKRGALLVADDVGNAIWRVTADNPQTAANTVSTD